MHSGPDRADSTLGGQGDTFLPAGDAEQAVTRSELAADDHAIPPRLVGPAEVNAGCVHQSLPQQLESRPTGPLQGQQTDTGRAGQRGGQQPDRRVAWWSHDGR